MRRKMKSSTQKYVALFVVMAFVAIGLNVRAQETETLVANPFWATPVSNPVYLDTATIKHELSLVYLFQRMPAEIDTAGGVDADLDGDLQAVAIQLEWPFAENWSFIANKSGYIDFNPNSTLLENEDGYTDLAAGVKYGFWLKESVAAAVRATVEFTNGDEHVFQGNGEGNVSPAFLMTWMGENMALNSVVGATIPFNNSEESTVGYLALGYAQRLTDRFSVLAELNWFRVLHNGNAEADFSGQGGSVVPQNVEFEGGDLINFGSENADEHADFVSAAIGGRYQFSDNVSLGVAYERPLTEKKFSLMEDRVTANLSVSF